MVCKSKIPFQLNTHSLWLSIHECVYKFANWFQSLADGSISTFWYFISIVFLSSVVQYCNQNPKPSLDAMWFLQMECACHWIVQFCTFSVWQSIRFPFFLTFIPHFSASRFLHQWISTEVFIQFFHFCFAKWFSWIQFKLAVYF